MGGEWDSVCSSSELPDGESRVTSSGVAVFRRNGKLFAIEDRCSHGRGSLSTGDIEDIDPKRVCHGTALSGTTSCVKCPRHVAKFGGGLWYSLETGASLTLGETSHHSDIYRVGSFATKEEGGMVYVSTKATTTSPALGLADKVKIRMHKLSKAIGCASCGPSSAPLSSQPGKRPAASGAGCYDWAVESCAKVSHDSIILSLKAPGGGKGGASITGGDLWHVSLRVGAVERDYTPVTSLQEYRAGRMTLWIRIYPGGELTPKIQEIANSGSRVLSSSPPESTLVLKPPPGVGVHHLVLISGGTGLAPILQALKSALGLDSGPGGFSSVLLVHSTRTASDVALLPHIARALSSPNRRAVPVQVHFAVTGQGGGSVVAPFPCSQSTGRLTEQVLAGLWAMRGPGICIVSGPQSMLDWAGGAVLRACGITTAGCHLLEA